MMEGMKERAQMPLEVMITYYLLLDLAFVVLGKDSSWQELIRSVEWIFEKDFVSNSNVFDLGSGDI